MMVHATVLSAIIAAVPQAIVFVDNLGRRAWVNAPARVLLRLPETGDIAPESISYAMRRLREDAQNQDDIERRWRESMQSPKSPILDWAWYFSDDYHVQALNVSSVPTIDEDVPGRLWIFHDVSALYRAQNDLKVANNEMARANAELVEKNTLLAEAQKEIERQLEEQVELTRLLEAANAAFEYKNAQLKDVNAELEQSNRRLADLNQEKNEIIGIVVHDLKNPINAMQMMADLMLSEPENTEQIQLLSSHIVELANRTMVLIKNLLDINRLEVEALHFTATRCRLLPILTMALEQYQTTATKKNIVLRYGNPTNDANEVFVLADEQALVQVIDNLISNAVKYSPQGKNVSVRLCSGEHTARVEVQDEGPGLSEEDMKKLFGKFARLSARPTGGEHSTGLGLSIVKKLVEAMNGKVWCESELGKGATFVVELPRVP